MGAREKILETAMQLFSTQGYADTSLAQVARTVQVSKALVLWHFESKERLFRAAVEHFLVPYQIDAQVLSGLTASEQVEKLIDDYYDFIAEHLYSVKFVLGQVVGGDATSQEVVAQVRELHSVYRGLLTSILEHGQASGAFPPQLQPAEDAALIVATLNGLLLQQLVEHEHSSHSRALLLRFKHAVRARLFPQASWEQVSDTVGASFGQVENKS